MLREAVGLMSDPELQKKGHETGLCLHIALSPLPGRQKILAKISQ